MIHYCDRGCGQIELNPLPWETDDDRIKQHNLRHDYADDIQLNLPEDTIIFIETPPKTMANIERQRLARIDNPDNPMEVIWIECADSLDLFPSKRNYLRELLDDR